VSVPYVGAVAALAALGFRAGLPAPILLAVAFTLPASLLTVPGYYACYGVLGLVPGANPSSSSGSAVGSADGGTLATTATGEPATWFVTTTHTLGVLALTAAAVLDVVLVRALAARRRRNVVSRAPGR
jgi:hypothetical protein